MFYYNDKVLVIGEFNNIISIDEQKMEFDFKKYLLQVEGYRLKLPYFEDKEVGIKGVIKNINIIYKSGDSNV